MSVATQITTAEQLLRAPQSGQSSELINGRLVQITPAGWEHGRIAMRLGAALHQFVDQHGLGICVAAETGFLLSRDPDTVRAPDVAYVSSERFSAVEGKPRYLPVAPNLVVEVVSPSDRNSEVEEKVQHWLDFGVDLVWVVRSKEKNVTAYSHGDAVVLGDSDLLEAPGILPGFSLAVAELF